MRRHASSLVLLLVLTGCNGAVGSPTMASGKPVHVVPVVGRAHDALAPSVPGCEPWPTTAPATADGWPTYFGCANALNLVRMVADPRELTHPKPSAPADGDRMGQAVDAQRNGKAKPLPVDQIAPIQQRLGLGG
jgi:type IV pilus biogenesis protein CpaD/CtpE